MAVPEETLSSCEEARREREKQSEAEREKMKKEEGFCLFSRIE